jgi:hypothetical protein
MTDFKNFYKEMRKGDGMRAKHRKWPLTTPVMVKTPQGYLLGKVMKHISPREGSHAGRNRYKYRCYVDFRPALVDMDGYGLRFSAIVPFRSIRKVKP